MKQKKLISVYVVYLKRKVQESTLNIRVYLTNELRVNYNVVSKAWRDDNESKTGTPLIAREGA